MQHLSFFFRLIILFFLFLWYPIALKADIQLNELNTADSLFQKGNFTQALIHYEKNYNHNESYSLSSLLKMSFLYEEKGDIVSTIYFLSLYHTHTYNQKAIERINQLANQYHLQGYEESEWESFLFLFKQNQFVCSIILIFISSISIVFLFYQKRKKRILSIPLFILSLPSLILLAIITNYHIPSKALINNNTVHVMNQPAASATSIGFFQKGDRVIIKGSFDVWNKIEWNGHTGYVKKYDLIYLP